MNKTFIEDLRKKAAETNAEILVVSKNRPITQIQDLYDLGFRKMGENRVQALIDKKDDLPSDISWHLIGHLQKNKVKYIAGFVEMIHSVDSLGLMKQIEKEALNKERKIDILLQFKVAQEDSKFGLDPLAISDFMDKLLENEYPHVNIRGIMGMASFSDNKAQLKAEFSSLKSIFDNMKDEYFQAKSDFDTLSMGMSSDYEIALEEGSTLLRLGSILFN